MNSNNNWGRFNNIFKWFMAYYYEVKTLSILIYIFLYYFFVGKIIKAVDYLSLVINICWLYFSWLHLLSYLKYDLDKVILHQEYWESLLESNTKCSKRIASYQQTLSSLNPKVVPPCRSPLDLQFEDPQRQSER